MRPTAHLPPPPPLHRRPGPLDHPDHLHHRRLGLLLHRRHSARLRPINRAAAARHQIRICRREVARAQEAAVRRERARVGGGEHAVARAVDERGLLFADAPHRKKTTPRRRCESALTAASVSRSQPCPACDCGAPARTVSTVLSRSTPCCAHPARLPSRRRREPDVARQLLVDVAQRARHGDAGLDAEAETVGVARRRVRVLAEDDGAHVVKQAVVEGGELLLGRRTTRCVRRSSSQIAGSQSAATRARRRARAPTTARGPSRRRSTTRKHGPAWRGGTAAGRARRRTIFAGVASR